MVLTLPNKPLLSSLRHPTRLGLGAVLALVCGVLAGACGLESREGAHGAGETGSTDLTSGLDTLEIPDTLVAGARLFEARCSVCHGVVAGGTEMGPALVHAVYASSHHADVSFYRAVEFGVRAHHWTFGNMEPMEGVSRADVGAIVRYIRWLQRAAGIE